MSWTADLTVTNVNQDDPANPYVTASGPATGTDDDGNVVNVTCTIGYNSAPHLAAGAVITVTGNC